MDSKIKIERGNETKYFSNTTDAIKWLEETVPDEERVHAVYKHVFPSGLVYIGRTKLGECRWGCKGINYKSHNEDLYKTAEEQGWENGEHIFLKENLSYHEAEVLEKLYILAYDSEEKGLNKTNIKRSLLQNKGRSAKEEHKTLAEKEIIRDEEIFYKDVGFMKDKGSRIINLIKNISNVDISSFLLEKNIRILCSVPHGCFIDIEEYGENAAVSCSDFIGSNDKEEIAEVLDTITFDATKSSEILINPSSITSSGDEKIIAADIDVFSRMILKAQKLIKYIDSGERIFITREMVKDLSKKIEREGESKEKSFSISISFKNPEDNRLLPYSLMSANIKMSELASEAKELWNEYIKSLENPENPRSLIDFYIISTKPQGNLDWYDFDNMKASYEKVKSWFVSDPDPSTEGEIEKTLKLL